MKQRTFRHRGRVNEISPEAVLVAAASDHIFSTAAAGKPFAVQGRYATADVEAFTINSAAVLIAFSPTEADNFHLYCAGVGFVVAAMSSRREYET